MVDFLGALYSGLRTAAGTMSPQAFDAQNRQDEDAKRLAMAQNVQIASDRDARIQKVIAGISAGAVDPVAGNHALQQMGYDGPPVGKTETAQLATLSLQDKQAEDARKANYVAGEQATGAPADAMRGQTDPTTGQPFTQDQLDAATQTARDSNLQAYGSDAQKAAAQQQAATAGNKSDHVAWHQGQDGEWTALRLNPNDTVSAFKSGVIGKPSASELAAGAEMTPEAIHDAAVNYNITHQLPPLGMGGAKGKIAILSEASKLLRDSGKTAEEAVVQQQISKAGGQALGQLTKQEAMVGAFEKTATKSADLSLSLSDKVDRLGSPVFDKWLQAGRKSLAGNADVTNLAVANNSLVTEYAKIMSGSMGNTAVSDSARAHAADLINAAMTKEQYAGAIATLKKEMAYRMQSYKDQRKELIDASFGGASASTGSGGMNATWGAINDAAKAKAIAKLKANPGLKPVFISTFGALPEGM